MELAEVIAELERHSSENADAVIAALPASLRQTVYNNGHQSGLAINAKGREKAERERDEAVAERDRLKERVTELESKAPDAQSLKAQYDTALTEAKTKFDEKATALQTRLNKALRDSAQKTIETALLGLGLKEVSARVRARDAVETRIRFDEEGNATALQDGRDIPMDIPAGKQPLDVLAHDLFKASDPDERKMGVANGAGVRDAAGATTSGTGRWDKIRAEKRAEEEAKAKAGTSGYVERLKLTP